MQEILKAKKLAPGSSSTCPPAKAKDESGEARRQPDPASVFLKKCERGVDEGDADGSESPNPTQEVSQANGNASAAAEVCKSYSEYAMDLHAEQQEEARPDHWLIDSKYFTATIYILIFGNTIQMGLSVDYTGGAWDDVWLVCEYFFTVAFTIEMVVKLAILKPRAYFALGWNCLDCFLVTMSLVDLAISMILGGSSPLGDISILRMLRIIRVMRIARLLKVFKELWMIIKGIIDSLGTMFWVSMLIILILYCCAILCIDVVGRKGANTYPASSTADEDLKAQEDVAGFNNYMYFGTIGRSMYTLFCLATLLEFPEFARPIFEKQPEMILLFLVFIVFTSFGIMNVIIGVIVDNTMEAAQAMQKDDDAKEKAMKIQLLEQIRVMIFALDEDNSGSISAEELEKGLEVPEVKECLDLVKLPKGFDAHEILSLLDQDGDGILDFKEFMWSFYRLINNDSFQGTCLMHTSLNQLKTDILTISKASQASFAKIDECLAPIEARLLNAGV